MDATQEMEMSICSSRKIDAELLEMLAAKESSNEKLTEELRLSREKMYTAVRYMLNFWRELINYTNEGYYTIDNSAAERRDRRLLLLDNGNM